MKAKRANERDIVVKSIFSGMYDAYDQVSILENTYQYTDHRYIRGGWSYLKREFIVQYHIGLMIKKNQEWLSIKFEEATNYIFWNHDGIDSHIKAKIRDKNYGNLIRKGFVDIVGYDQDERVNFICEVKLINPSKRVIQLDIVRLKEFIKIMHPGKKAYLAYLYEKMTFFSKQECDNLEKAKEDARRKISSSFDHQLDKNITIQIYVDAVVNNCHFENESELLDADPDDIANDINENLNYIGIVIEISKSQ